MAKLEMAKNIHLLCEIFSLIWKNFGHSKSLWQCLCLRFFSKLKHKRSWLMSNWQKDHLIKWQIPFLSLQMDSFCHFKFCHNRWNGFRIIKRPLFGSICQAIMDQRISLPDRGSRGKIARELTMMRFIYHLFNSVSIPYVILDEYILSFKYTYIEKKIIFFSHSKHKDGNTKDNFNILK